MMNEILRKLTSRKFILAVVGMVASLALANGVEGGEITELVGLVGGILGAVGSAITYINAEAKVDAAREANAPAVAIEQKDTAVEGFK